MSKWLVLSKFYLDSGTEYEAKRVVEHPDYIYEGRVLEYGHIDRSIPVPSGLPQVGDTKVRMADTDRKWRTLLSAQTPRRRMLELRAVPEGESESAFEVLGTFEILDAEFGPGDVTVKARDITFAWLHRKIPNIINRTNFPELAEGIDEAFFPIITGIVVSPAANPQGVIPLPHIGTPFPALPSSPESEGGAAVVGEDRWALSATPIAELVSVYRRQPGEGDFTLVDSSEYFVTADERTIEGLAYNLQWLDFFALQPAGTEIRVDVKGITFRGDWNGIPASNGSPLRNPIDFLINMLYAVLTVETNLARFHAASFNELWLLFGADGSFGISDETLDYKCDGALTESMTVQEFLARFLTSFEIDFFPNKFGEIQLGLTRVEDPDRPVFSDELHIGRNTVRQRLANPTFNQFRYRYEPNYATNQWATQEIYDNVADQIALGEVEPDIVDLWWVRDAFTALHVTTRRAAFVALGSFRIEMDLPFPEVRGDIELAKQVGITHYGGLQEGGYVNREIKTTGLTTDLQRLRTTLRGIVRVPQQFTLIESGFLDESAGTPAPFDSFADFDVEINSYGDYGQGCQSNWPDYYADNFDRADTTSGFNSTEWTITSLNTWRLLNRRAKSLTGSGFARVNCSTLPTDHDHWVAEITWEAANYGVGADGGGLGLWITANGVDGYSLKILNVDGDVNVVSRLVVTRWNSGVGNTLATATMPDNPPFGPLNKHRYRFEVFTESTDGDVRLKVYTDVAFGGDVNVLKISVLDTTGFMSPGRPGMISGGTTELNDFYCETIN